MPGQAGNAPTYEIAHDGSTIKCLRCGRTSYSQGDVQNRYCGACGYHEPFTSESVVGQPVPFRVPWAPVATGRRK